MIEAGSGSGGSLHKVVDDVSNRRESPEVVVVQLDVVLLLKGNGQLDVVERSRFEIFFEGRVASDLLGIDPELLHDDASDGEHDLFVALHASEPHPVGRAHIPSTVEFGCRLPQSAGAGNELLSFRSTLAALVVTWIALGSAWPARAAEGYTSLRPLAAAPTSDLACGLAIHGDTICVADSDGGLRIFDIADPAHPVDRGAVALPGSARKVAVDGPLAYVAAMSGGLQVVDLVTAGGPMRISGLQLEGRARGVAVAGAHAYVAADLAGLAVVDVADPRDPHVVGRMPLAGIAHDVCILGSIVLVANSEVGLQVVDVSNPAAPRLVSEMEIAGGIYGVSAGASRAYVGGNTSGLMVIDLTDPGKPSTVGSVEFLGTTAIRVDGEYAFVSAYSKGVCIFDVSNPAAPVGLAAARTGGEAYDVLTRGGLGYVANGRGGMAVIEVIHGP